jgi:hypothetical protein
MSTIQELNRDCLSSIFNRPAFGPQEICALRGICRQFRDTIDADAKIWRSLELRVSSAEFTTLICNAARVGSTLINGLIGSYFFNVYRHKRPLLNDTRIGQALTCAVRSGQLNPVVQILTERPKAASKNLLRAMISAVATRNVDLLQRLMQLEIPPHHMSFCRDFARVRGVSEVLMPFFATCSASEEEFMTVSNLRFAVINGLDEVVELCLSQLRFTSREIIDALRVALNDYTIEQYCDDDRFPVIEKLLNHLLADPSVMPTRDLTWVMAPLVEMSKNCMQVKSVELFFKNPQFAFDLETMNLREDIPIPYSYCILKNLAAWEWNNHPLMRFLSYVDPRTLKTRLECIILQAGRHKNWGLVEQILNNPQLLKHLDLKKALKVFVHKGNLKCVEFVLKQPGFSKIMNREAFEWLSDEAFIYDHGYDPWHIVLDAFETEKSQFRDSCKLLGNKYLLDKKP